MVRLLNGLVGHSVSPVETRAEVKKDPFRQSLLRYGGYLNEMGEGLKSFLPRWAYLGSYALTWAYITADSFHKGTQGFDANRREHEAARGIRAVGHFGDAFVFQSVASGIVPAAVVGWAHKQLEALGHRQAWPAVAKKFGPAGSLLLIPVVGPIIDHSTEFVLRQVLRPAAGKLEPWLLARLGIDATVTAPKKTEGQLAAPVSFHVFHNQWQEQLSG